MNVFAFITLILTAFTLLYYCYIANNTEEHDVSFFISVELIIMVMNLCTNQGGVFGLAWLYLVVDLVFLGVGWLIDAQDSVGFYTSIGPWFKNTFTDKDTILWKVLSFVLFPAGAVLYFVKYNNDATLAKTCGRAAFFGLLLWIVLLWAILGLAL